MKSFAKLTFVLVISLVLLSSLSFAMGSKKATAEKKCEAKQKCEVKSVNSESADKPKLSLAPAEPDSSEAAVIINGDKITQAEIDAQIEEKLSQLPAQIPEQQKQQYRQRLKQQVVQQVVVEKLLNEKIADKNIEISDQQVLDFIRERASQQETPMSLEEVKQLIEAQGQDFEQVKENIAKQLKYEKLFEEQFKGKIEVTEEQAKQYYEDNKEQFENPEEVKASHILIKPDTSDPNADPNAADLQAKQKAENLLKQIHEGSDLATLAKANSDCPSGKKGGDLGFFSKGKMVPAFEEAAFAMDVNDISDVVETRFGYHIIKVTDKKDANTVSFEQAKEQIIEQLENQKKSELAQQYIKELKEHADIKYPGKPSVNPMPEIKGKSEK